MANQGINSFTFKPSKASMLIASLSLSVSALAATPSASSTLHPFDSNLLSQLLKNAPTDYSSWNATNQGYGLGLSAQDQANALNPCSTDFNANLPGIQQVTASGVTLKAGAAEVLACLTPNPNQIGDQGTGSGNFNSLLITGPFSPNQPGVSYYKGSQTAISAGYINASNPVIDGSVYAPHEIKQVFYTTAGTYTSANFFDMASVNSGAAAKLKVYLYQNPANTNDRLPNIVSPDSLYPTNLVYDHNNAQRSNTVATPQVYNAAYPFLIQLHSETHTANNWSQLYHPFDKTDPAPTAITTDVNNANTALNDPTHTPVYAINLTPQGATETTQVKAVGYYSMKSSAYAPISSSSPITWAPLTGTDTAHYHFNFWVKAEDKSDTSALQTAFKCNAGIESIVNVSDKVTYQGGDINTDPNSSTSCTTPDTNGWFQVTQSYIVNSVKPVYPVINASSISDINYDITDFSFTKVSSTSQNVPANTPDVIPTTGTSLLAAYDFNKDSITPNDSNKPYAWRIRNQSPGGSGMLSGTTSGSNIEYVDASTMNGSTSKEERVLRFRNFGGDDTPNTFSSNVITSISPLAPVDSLGYKTAEQQGGMITTGAAFGNADYVICARFPRRDVAAYLNTLKVPQGTYYPYNTGGVSSFYASHELNLNKGMIGNNDFNDSPIRNSEVDIELPAFDGDSAFAPFPKSSAGINNYSYRVMRQNAWGGNYAGYGNNVSARPASPFGTGLDDGKFHQLTIETVADTQGVPGYVKWYYNDQCTVQQNMRASSSYNIKASDLGSAIQMSDDTQKSGVLLPATMGTLSSNQLQWQGNSIQNGFDAIPNQAMQLTIGIWNPNYGLNIDADNDNTKQAMTWAGTPDYIDEDHAGADPRFIKAIPTGAASFRCGINARGQKITDIDADTIDPDCQSFVYKPGIASTPDRNLFLNNWALQMSAYKNTYHLPALNPARNDDVYINPIDMTTDSINQPINAALTKASFGGTMPTADDLTKAKNALEKFDNERDLDVSSIYIFIPPGQSVAASGVLDTYNTNDYSDLASCADVNATNNEQIITGCTAKQLNSGNIYQFPNNQGHLTTTTYPIDPTAKNN